MGHRPRQLAGDNNLVPIYSYRCKECKALVDRMVSIGDDEPTECEVCGGDLRRDWKVEGAISNFHPTKDLYALSLKQRKQRK